ncbi:hypothetical protein AS593_03715 [Caulobacter vibrioides]|nr:hypothetical protein AS593_03715 [Caulobacter vibrioides]
MTASHGAPARARLARALNGDRPLRLAVTGATGWLGSTLAHMARAAGLSHENGRLRLFGSTARDLAAPDGGTLRIESLADAAPLEGEDWVVAHFAFLGKERTVDLSPDDFEAINHAILAQTQALVAGARAPRIIFSSSGAAYAPGGGLVSERAASPYGYLKVVHEQAIAAWASERGLPLIIPRVFNVGGPYGNKLELYAMSSLIRAAAAGGPLTINARRPVFRSFVHVEELMTVLVAEALRAVPGQVETFDTGGREIVEIGDLARVVARRFGLPEDGVSRDYDPAQPEDWYVGSPRAYQAALARAGLEAVSLEGIVADAAADIGR